MELATLASRTSNVVKTHTTTKIVVTLAGVLGMSLVAGQIGATPTAHADAGLYYHPGYSVQHSWLCYGWSNGIYHCTQHWYATGGQYVSLNRAWVPSSGSGGTGGSSAVAHTNGGGGGGGVSSVGYSQTPGGINEWAYTGHPAYGTGDFAGDPYAGYFGNCTWYAWSRHQNEPLMQLGSAGQWAYNASSRGLRTGYSPAVGATAVFQGGVQGADAAGHAAHVEAVYGNGWFLVSEMNFYWNGGGWGRVSFRYAHVGAGVSFIY
ncbi:MAG: CHAP domain-containing protein [Ktedonobacterales bacterium]